MTDEDNTDNQSRRYNTRPKTKTSFEALESKYSNFVVGTTPKVTKKPKGNEDPSDENQTRQMKTRLQPMNQELPRFSLGSYNPNPKATPVGTQMPNQPLVQRLGQDSGQNPMFNPKQPTTMAPNMQYMHNQQAYKMPPNYQGMFRQNPLQPGTKPPMVFNQMQYQGDPKRFMMPNPSYNPNTQFAMRPQTPTQHPQSQPQTQQYQGFQGPGPQAKQPYGFPNVNLNAPQLLEKSPQRPSQMSMTDPRLMVRSKLYTPKRRFQPPFSPMTMMPKVLPLPEKPSQLTFKVSGHPQNDQIQNYFSAVDMILKDISETKKFEKPVEKYDGRLSVPESFEFPDFHKLVSFDYLIDSGLYLDVLSFFKLTVNPEVELPFNSANPEPQNTTPISFVNDNLSTTALCSEKTDTASPVENADRKAEDEVQRKFNLQMIQLVREKKIFPITFESCKEMTFEEFNPFFTLLTKSECKIMRKSGLKRCKVKSIISSQENNKSHYLVYTHEENDVNKYSLRYQFGCFFGNDFFNKRVPLFTMVDFGEVDPSFMFTRNMDKKKYLKTSLNFLKVYRTFDVLVEKLNFILKFEVSKLLVESDNDLKNTKHQLTIQCNLETVPRLLKSIHFNTET